MTMASTMSSSPARRKRIDRATKVFWRVVLVGAILGILSFSFSRIKPGSEDPTVLTKRANGDLATVKDVECHLVHKVADQCAFVLANCDDEELGFIPYLQFYFCTLPHVKAVAFTIIVLWMGLLFSTIGLAASDFFCVNLGSIATMAGLSENFAGVTLLALGNGSPDVFSTFAAMYNNSGSLAIGELIGAAGFITAVVAGSMAFIRPFKVPKRAFMRDVIFFIVAAAFTLGFLADGNLYLWECIVMVVMYIFYVGLVVWWHWYFKKKRRIRLLDDASRSHYSFPGTGAVDPSETYQDEDEDRDPRDRTPSRSNTTEDFYALERGAGEDDDDLEDEDMRERCRGEISSRMRLRRPINRRQITHDPIRPSLLGALEFRSVLSGLHREGNLQAYPLHPRRYSDDPSLILSDARSTKSLPNKGNDFLRPPNHPALHQTPSGTRSRATSAIEPGIYANRLTQTVPRIDLLGPLADEDMVDAQPLDSADLQADLRPPPSPAISISPPASEHPGEESYISHSRIPSQELLAPPGLIAPKFSGTSNDSSQFPIYSDDSFPTSPLSGPAQSPFMPPVSAGTVSDTGLVNDGSSRPLTWWPYWILPTPETILSSLFPTLYMWKEKGFWGRLFGVISAPSVFLLTITLPVVEMVCEDEHHDADIPEISLPPTISSSQIIPQQRDRTTDSGSRSTNALRVSVSETNPLASGATRIEDLQMTDSPEQLPQTVANSNSGDWNRWLVMLQVFTAPFFCILIIWANMDFENMQLLLHMSFGSLAFSILAFTFIALRTSPDQTPRWHGLLCILGFCVSIAWISTIASEVVGVLKALGVIVNISDAILGLTVFAVGNSLGDLVADVTMAKLGYPIMALSACFGGPMLNILLGIGISGAYMTVQGAQKRAHKHPNKKLKFKPYVVEVDRTLLISGVALLVTLLGLLVVVPMRKWKMDRFIGWSLIGLWVVATIGNLGTEIWLGPGKVNVKAPWS